MQLTIILIQLDVNPNDNSSFDIVSPIVSVGDDECLVCGQSRNYVMDLRNLKRLKYHLGMILTNLQDENAKISQQEAPVTKASAIEYI